MSEEHIHHTTQNRPEPVNIGSDSGNIPQNNAFTDTSSPLIFNKSLKKKTYYHKDAIQVLDEEFIEFAPKKPNKQRFFGIYEELFYDMPKTHHGYFLNKSSKYVGPYESPKQKEILNLENQIEELKRQINSVEQHHPFFKNGEILINENDWDTGIGRIAGKKYYIMSGKKRMIPEGSGDDNYKYYLPIKKRLGFMPPTGEINDVDYAIKVSTATLNAIPNGPPIESLSDLFIPIFEVNTYNGQGV